MKNLDAKITRAQERIEALYNDTEGKCYLSFSGGKDSTVILALIKQCEDLLTIPPGAIPAVFNDTGIELGATTEFVYWVQENWYSNVITIRHDKRDSFDWILKNKGKPIKSKLKSENLGKRQRNPDNPFYLKQLLGDDTGHYKSTMISDHDLHLIHPDFDIRIDNKCCQYLKKKPFDKWAKDHDVKGYMVGERAAEGGARQLNMNARIRAGGTACTRTKGNMIVKLPIVDWTDEDVDQFIKMYNIPLSKAYTLYGAERTGCIGCPFAGQRLTQSLKALFDYEPLRYQAALHWLKDVYIAQDVILPFDLVYEKERVKKWNDCYLEMRMEMLMKYRPGKKRIIELSQYRLF